MDAQVIKILRDYINGTGVTGEYEIYTVWKCKTLQNWKYLLSTTLQDGMYYELTYNGDKQVWYLDAYKKMDNQTVVYGE